MEAEQDILIDQNRYSRQLAIFGNQAQSKLMKMRVFINGVTGLGVQVVKNLVMIGVRSVTLYDPHIVTMADVGRNFYCSENDVGKITRAHACLPKLQQLNPQCIVKVTQDNSVQYIVQNFDFVVIVDNYDKNYITKVNQQFRKNNIGFILAGCLGLYGYLFNDFGQSHIIEDSTGQQPENIYINSIQQGQKTLIQCTEWNRHGLETGDIVEFKSVEGMTQINGMKFQVKKINSYMFQIGDTRNFQPYQAEGIAKKLIKPVKLCFKNFNQSFLNFSQQEIHKITSTFIEFDQSNPFSLHLTLNQIYQFYEKQNRLPKLLDQQDSLQIVKNVKEKYDTFNKNKTQSFQPFNQQVVRNIAFYAETQISPVFSFFGGIVAQQVVKYTGKYIPINQWLHKQFFYLLPNIQNENEHITRNMMINNNRYKDYIALFGDNFINDCKKFNILLAGSGSLGCEILKNLSLMGVSSGQNYKITIADDKLVKNHNLNSHFLLTQKDLQTQKVQSVIKNIKNINKEINLEAFSFQISQNNEEIFNDDFWSDIDLVLSTVDNSRSINHIDQRCVWYEKPVFHSAIQGLKGSCHVVLPHKTSTITDIAEQQHLISYDFSTLLNFPYKTQHLIDWAYRLRFQDFFIKSAEYLNQFYLSPSKFLSQVQKEANNSYYQRLLQRLQKVKKLHLAKIQKSYQKCIQFMIEEFQYWFIDRVRRTILNFDTVDNQQRRRNFWTGMKRKPQHLEFDLRDPLTLQFVHSGANIYAQILNIPLKKDSKLVQKIAQRVYERMQQQRIQSRNIRQTEEQEFLRLIRQLNNFTVKGSDIPKIIKLDLQNEQNGHLQYIFSAVNLRARVYRIERIDKLKVLIHAGKIIPKMVTSASITAGLAVMEIIKFILKKDLKSHKNSSSNLALPLFVFSQPSQPIQNCDKQFDPIMVGPVVAIPGRFTKWDKIDIKKPMLLCQLIDYFKKTYNVKVSAIVYGKQFFYCEWFPLKSAPRLIMSVQDAISQAVKKRVYKYKRILKIQICGQTPDGIDCLFPQVRYFISTKKY